MCTICGGTNFDIKAYNVFMKSRDRGKDYGNLFLKNKSWICNHRAVPTTELENPEFNQPFGSKYKIVHNGTIANDKELGNKDGMIDSYILSKCLNCSTLQTLYKSIQKIQGSYAIAILKPNGTFYLACNYKPIFYAKEANGEFTFSSYKHHLSGYQNVHRMEPYSILDSETMETMELPRKEYDNAVVICSGGLDSTAVAAYAVKKHKKVTLLHFQYGCIAETKEVSCVKRIADYLKCDYQLLPIDNTFLNGQSALFDDKEKITEGIKGAEYAYEWVPARNLIMLSIAVGFAEANKFSHIYLGTNLEESGAYPDNEEQFIKDFNACLYGAVQNGVKVTIHTPLGNLMKHEIVKFGNEYNAPFHLTWSCYKDGKLPCGNCGPCFMRQTAFARNGLKDPLIYEEEEE